MPLVQECCFFWSFCPEKNGENQSTRLKFPGSDDVSSEAIQIKPHSAPTGGNFLVSTQAGGPRLMGHVEVLWMGYFMMSIRG